MVINDAAVVYMHTGMMTSGSNWDTLSSGKLGSFVFSKSWIKCSVSLKQLGRETLNSYANKVLDYWIYKRFYDMFCFWLIYMNNLGD